MKTKTYWMKWSPNWQYVFVFHDYQLVSIDPFWSWESQVMIVTIPATCPSLYSRHSCFPLSIQVNWPVRQHFGLYFRASLPFASIDYACARIRSINKGSIRSAKFPEVYSISYSLCHRLEAERLLKTHHPWHDGTPPIKTMCLLSDLINYIYWTKRRNQVECVQTQHYVFLMGVLTKFVMMTI